MRTFEILAIAKEFLLLGMAVVILGTLFYFILGKGKRKIKLASFIGVGCFICYLVVVFGGTMFMRFGGSMRGFQLHPFYSYREAWQTFSKVDWRNIIINILMFIPFGFLLPVISKGFQRFWKTYLAGLGFTLLIETAQLITARGLFDVDDIINNVLGAMIGYGIYALAMYIISIKKKWDISIIKTVILQLPLVILVAVFITIFAVYKNKDLGNLEYRYICPVAASHFAVTSDQEYSDENATGAVYKVKVLSVAETEEKAQELFGKRGSQVDKDKNDIYDETAVYYSLNGNSVWIDYRGGTYNYTRIDGEKAEFKEDASEKEIRSGLKTLGIEIPVEAEFNEQGNGVYTFAVNQIEGEAVMYNGNLTCTYLENGEFERISNGILVCSEYKEFPLISENEAYQWICNGKFNDHGDNRYMDIKAGKGKLIYKIDSKGFYQPVYSFEAEINGVDTEINIPAVKE